MSGLVRLKLQLLAWISESSKLRAELKHQGFPQASMYQEAQRAAYCKVLDRLEEFESGGTSKSEEKADETEDS